MVLGALQAPGVSPTPERQPPSPGSPLLLLRHLRGDPGAGTTRSPEPPPPAAQRGPSSPFFTGSFSGCPQTCCDLGPARGTHSLTPCRPTFHTAPRPVQRAPSPPPASPNPLLTHPVPVPMPDSPPGALGPTAQTRSRMAPAAQPQQSADRGPSPGSWPRDPSPDSDLTSSPLGPTACAGGPPPSLAARSRGALAAPGLCGVSPDTSPKSCALRGVGV